MALWVTSIVNGDWYSRRVFEDKRKDLADDDKELSMILILKDQTDEAHPDHEPRHISIFDKENIVVPWILYPKILKKGHYKNSFLALCIIYQALDGYYKRIEDVVYVVKCLDGLYFIS